MYKILQNKIILIKYSLSVKKSDAGDEKLIYIYI